MHFLFHGEKQKGLMVANPNPAPEGVYTETMQSEKREITIF
jgi:hypothetical protein